MENQRKNSGAEQEKLRQQLQKAQDAIKTSSKEMKDIKQKLGQVSFVFCVTFTDKFRVLHLSEKYIQIGQGL